MRRPAGNSLLALLAFAVQLLAASAACAQMMTGKPDGIQQVQEKRVALVIGNSTYVGAPLPNPANDAADMAAKLRSLGFEVVERSNLRTSQIGRTLRDFRSRLSAGSVALVFYAGHGLQIRGENYLPTVDADIEGEEDVPNQSLGVRQVLELLDEAKTRLNLIFLDACRNNPYNRRFRASIDGLAKVNAPSGTLMSFATRPGGFAIDGEGRNGLYTAHLLKVMDVPNLAIEQALKRVVSGVRAASRGQQEPWMEGSIEGDFYFKLQKAASGDDQQEVIDKAVQEALRRSSEQAAKERAELQAAIEKILQQALVRQGAQGESVVPPPAAVPVAKAMQQLAPRIEPAAAKSPLPVASRPPEPKVLSQQVNGAAAGQVRAGDEWEYAVRDEKFGKSRKLVFRVKGDVPGGGALEELYVDGRPIAEWAFDGRLYAVGVPTESEFVIGPHWTGKELQDVEVHGSSACLKHNLTCRLRLKKAEAERVTVAAGSFDAIRIDGEFTAANREYAVSGPVSIWYDVNERRLLKQTVRVKLGVVPNVWAPIFGQFNFDETFELKAIRRQQR